MSVLRDRKLTLLVSSMSARGRALLGGRRVVEILRRGGWEVTALATTAEHDIHATAAEMDAQSGYIGALGGDGFIARVASGVRGQDVPLIPFPSGRGNDLCRSLGIGPRAEPWAKLLARASREKVRDWTRPLDAMAVTPLDGGTSNTAFGIISMGIDARANQLANESWICFGPLAYAAGTVSAFFGKYKPQTLQIKVGDQVETLGGWLCSISNSGWFGGGVNLVAHSDSSDGILELLSVGPTSRWKLLPVLARVLLSRGADDPIIEELTVTDLEVLEPVGMAAMADGDVVARIPFRVHTLPGALDVIAADVKEFRK